MIINRRNSASRHFERSEAASSPSRLCEEKSLFALSSLILIASVWTLALPASTGDLPFGPWTRAANEPSLSPQGTTWESAGTFNPAVVFHNGKFVMLYRAQDASGTSRLGYAESADGLHFTRRPVPVLSPAARECLTLASSSLVLRPSSLTAASSSYTTAPTTSSFIAPPSPSSTAAIRANSSPAPTPPSSPPKNNGKKSARSPT